MPVTVQIPAPLRGLTGGATSVAVPAGTVRGALDALAAAHPDLGPRLFEGEGVKRFINLYLNDEDVRFLDNLQTAANDGDELAIIPAVAGG